MTQRLPGIVVIYNKPVVSNAREVELSQRLRRYTAPASVLVLSELEILTIRPTYKLAKWLSDIQHDRPTMIRTVFMATSATYHQVSDWIQRIRSMLVDATNKIFFTLMPWADLEARMIQTPDGEPLTTVTGLHDIQPFPAATGKYADGVSLGGKWGSASEHPGPGNAYRVYRLKYLPEFGLYKGVCVSGRPSELFPQRAIRNQYWEEHDIDLMQQIGWIGRSQDIRAMAEHNRLKAQNIDPAQKHQGDVYKEYAAQLFGKAVEEVSPRERKIGKSAVLGMGYYRGGIVTPPNSDKAVTLKTGEEVLPFVVLKSGQTPGKTAFISDLKVDEIPVVLDRGSVAVPANIAHNTIFGISSGEYDNQSYDRVFREEHSGGRVVRRLSWDLSYNRKTGRYTATNRVEKLRDVYLRAWDIKCMIASGKLVRVMEHVDPYPSLDMLNAAVKEFPRTQRPMAFKSIMLEHGKVYVSTDATADVMSKNRKAVIKALSDHVIRWALTPPKEKVLRFVGQIYDEAVFDAVEINTEAFPETIGVGSINIFGIDYQLLADVPKVVRASIIASRTGNLLVTKHIDLIAAAQVDRAKMGYEKYGTTMDRTDLTIAQLDQHAFEEALDLVIYLRARVAAMRRIQPDRSVLGPDEEWIDPLVKDAHSLLDGLARQVLRTNPKAPLVPENSYINPAHYSIEKFPFKFQIQSHISKE